MKPTSAFLPFLLCSPGYGLVPSTLDNRTVFPSFLPISCPSLQPSLGCHSRLLPTVKPCWRLGPSDLSLSLLPLASACPGTQQSNVLLPALGSASVPGLVRDAAHCPYQG